MIFWHWLWFVISFSIRLFLSLSHASTLFLFDRSCSFSFSIAVLSYCEWSFLPFLWFFFIIFKSWMSKLDVFRGSSIFPLFFFSLLSCTIFELISFLFVCILSSFCSRHFPFRLISLLISILFSSSNRLTRFSISRTHLFKNLFFSHTVRLIS